MNVASLLHDAPSEDRARRHEAQQREREREREREQQLKQQQQQQRERDQLLREQQQQQHLSQPPAPTYTIDHPPIQPLTPTPFVESIMYPRGPPTHRPPDDLHYLDRPLGMHPSSMPFHSHPPPPAPSSVEYVDYPSEYGKIRMKKAAPLYPPPQNPTPGQGPGTASGRHTPSYQVDLPANQQQQQQAPRRPSEPQHLSNILRPYPDSTTGSPLALPPLGGPSSPFPPNSNSSKSVRRTGSSSSRPTRPPPSNGPPPPDLLNRVPSSSGIASSNPNAQRPPKRDRKDEKEIGRAPGMPLQLSQSHPQSSSSVPPPGSKPRPPAFAPQPTDHRHTSTPHHPTPPSHSHPLPMSGTSPLESPPATLPLSPLHLGTFIFPDSPFPLPPSNSSRPVTLTVLIPYSHLPLAPPRVLAIWGGGIPHPSHGRIYTDDSMLLHCALHAGFISWEVVRSAREGKRDLKLLLRAWRKEDVDGKWPGGLGEGSGAIFESSGWGNGHDGGGVEVLRVEFVEKNVARSLHRPNRRTRLLEYAQRRASVLGSSPVRPNGIHKSKIPWDLETDTDEEERKFASLELIFDASGQSAGFKYDPRALRLILFPHAAISKMNARPKKRRKIERGSPLSDSGSAKGKEKKPSIWKVMLENDEERYIFRPLSVTSFPEDGRYELLCLPRRSSGKVSAPNGHDRRDEDQAEVIARNLAEVDLEFLESGIGVWNTSADQSHSQSPPTDQPQPNGHSKGNEKFGVFCEVKRWRWGSMDVDESV